MERFDLPWDLVEEILSRVPMKSLGRLQFTCKRWNALCQDPEFIKSHLEKEANRNLVHMLSNSRVNSLSINLNEIHNKDPSIEFTSKFIRKVEITQVFHCKGLLLCSTKEANETKLVVVNLSTGQTRWIEPISVYHKHDMYALGYENNNNNNKKSYDSYKILRIPNDWCKKLELFELKSNSWRVLAKTSPMMNPDINGKGVSLKGNTYWLYHLNTDILSFDFTTERFRRHCLPFKFCDITLSVVREEQLLLLRRNFKMLQIDIWVSNKINDIETVLSWSNSITFDLCRHFEHLCLSSVSFLIDEEKKVVVSCGRMNKKNMIHIVAEHCGCRNFEYDTNQSNHCPPFLFSYVPSLVSLYPPM